MTALLIVFGVLILLAGLVIIINPELIFGYLRDKHDKPMVHIFAVVMRFVIGALLVNQAVHSKYPVVVSALGWLTIIAAVVLATIGRKNFLRLMAWALNDLKAFARMGGVLAAAFGGFLIYAFV